MAQFCEVLMLVFFGCSWPINILKSVRSRTARGKSPLFLLCALVGYGFGLAGKFIGGNVTYVVFFYTLNAVMVATDLVLTLRNMMLDKKADRLAAKGKQV